MEISVILPLIDRRNCGWRALQSALEQTLARERYDVVAVLGQESGVDPGDDAELRALLAQCDAVVRLPTAAGVVENEILFFLAGYQRSRGQLLLFMEGHTVLQPQCCALIVDHFARHRGSELAFAPRINHQATPLGKLVALHNVRHEALTRDATSFSLGASHVISRALFERADGLDPRYLRYSEAVLSERLARAGVTQSMIAEPLAIHYNDFSLRHLLDITRAFGLAKFRYWNAGAPHHNTGEAQAQILELANRAWGAALLLPFAEVGGTLLLASATQLAHISVRAAYRLYRLGLRCTLLAGFCQARLRQGMAAARVGAYTGND